MLIFVIHPNSESLAFLHVHSDAKRGILNAVKRCFPQADHRMRHFHVSDSIRRHMAGLGLKKLLRTNKAFHHFYERCQNIFFFPETLWPALWELNISSLPKDTLEIQAVQAFIQYMTRTWFPTLLPIQPNAILFPPTYTCLFLSDGDLTNNHCEAYNARLTLKLGKNPNLVKFLTLTKNK